MEYDSTLAFYNEHAPDLVKTYAGAEPTYLAHLKTLLRRDSSTVLDVGCGTGRDVAALRAETQKTRIKYLEARLEWARRRLQVEDERLDVARAEFELAKARLVKKNNVPGASDIDIEDFEDQVANFEERVADADADVEEALAKLTEKEEAWVQASRALQQATGGALGSRFLED